MKVTANIQTPFFYSPAATSRLAVRRPVATRTERQTPIETSDELARKQEVVCGAILGLSLMSSVVLSFWQLARP